MAQARDTAAFGLVFVSVDLYSRSWFLSHLPWRSGVLFTRERLFVAPRVVHCASGCDARQVSGGRGADVKHDNEFIGVKLEKPLMLSYGVGSR
jgi:hypothetical protein